MADVKALYAQTLYAFIHVCVTISNAVVELCVCVFSKTSLCMKCQSLCNLCQINMRQKPIFEALAISSTSSHMKA